MVNAIYLRMYKSFENVQNVTNQICFSPFRFMTSAHFGIVILIVMFASLFLRVKCTSTTIKRNMLYRKWNASFPSWWWGSVHECGETPETSDRKFNCTKIRQIAPLQIIIITVVVQIHIVSSVFEFFYLNVHTMSTVKKRLTFDAFVSPHAKRVMKNEWMRMKF